MYFFILMHNKVNINNVLIYYSLTRFCSVFLVIYSNFIALMRFSVYPCWQQCNFAFDLYYVPTDAVCTQDATTIRHKFFIKMVRRIRIFSETSFSRHTCLLSFNKQSHKLPKSQSYLCKFSHTYIPPFTCHTEPRNFFISSPLGHPQISPVGGTLCSSYLHRSGDLRPLMTQISPLQVQGVSRLVRSLVCI